ATRPRGRPASGRPPCPGRRTAPRRGTAAATGRTSPPSASGPPAPATAGRGWRPAPVPGCATRAGADPRPCGSRPGPAARCPRSLLLLPGEVGPRLDDRLQAGPAPQLLQHPTHVAAHRRVRHVQPLGDLAVVQPFGHEREDLVLAGGEAGPQAGAAVLLLRQLAPPRQQ